MTNSEANSHIDLYGVVLGCDASDVDDYSVAFYYIPILFA